MCDHEESPATPPAPVEPDAGIAKTGAGKPKGKLVPSSVAEPRRAGGWEGEVWVAHDFDDRLPPEILAGFEGKG